MNKRFVHANDLLTDSFQLAVNVFEAGFRPDFLVGLWRGGSAVGIAVQEGLEHLGVATDHIAIRTSYSGADRYPDMVGQYGSVRVHGLQYLLENLGSHHKLLIVDDVYSSGTSVQAVVDQLARKTRRNLPHDIRIASVWFRPTEDARRVPDFYVHETADWLVLPYELTGMSIEELREHRSDITGVIDQLEQVLARRQA